MTNTKIHMIDSESALSEEIIAAVMPHFRDATIAYDADGDVAGIVYYADETDRYYAANIDDLRKYIETVLEIGGVDSYSIWCAATGPNGESDSEDECLAGMNWTA